MGQIPSFAIETGRSCGQGKICLDDQLDVRGLARFPARFAVNFKSVCMLQRKKLIKVEESPRSVVGLACADDEAKKEPPIRVVFGSEPTAASTKKVHVDDAIAGCNLRGLPYSRQ